MKTRELVEIRAGIVVTKEALEECHRILSDASERCAMHFKAVARLEPPAITPTYTARLADEAEVTFESFEELSNYSNRRDRRIVRLTAETRPHVSAPLSVRFSFGGLDRAFTATVEGEEADALRIKDRCKDVAARVRTRFGWLYSPYVMVGYVFAWLAWSVALGVALGNPTVAEKPYRWASDVSLALTIMLIGGAYVRGVLFPRVSFAIGQEAERIASIRGIRKWFLTAVVLGVPLALVVRYLPLVFGL